MSDDNDRPTSWFQVAAAGLASWSKWMQSQSFNNVLLVAILAAIGWGVHYALSEAIPSHIKTIQSGYKEIEANNQTLLKDMDAAHRAERREMFEMFDKWLKTDKVVVR